MTLTSTCLFPWSTSMGVLGLDKTLGMLPTGWEKMGAWGESGDGKQPSRVCSGVHASEDRDSWKVLCAPVYSAGGVAPWVSKASLFLSARKHALVQRLPWCFRLHSDQQEWPRANSIVPFCSSKPNLQDPIQMHLFYEALPETSATEISPFKLWLSFCCEWDNLLAALMHRDMRLVSDKGGEPWA